jgi:small subunit ribosomal protein S18
MASKPKRRPAKPRTGPGGSTRRKSCYFCKDKIEEIDYKNYNQLRRYVSEKGKIRSRRITTCGDFQRSDLAQSARPCDDDHGRRPCD